MRMFKPDESKRPMGKKILLIDDDPDILEVISMILENKGYTVKTSDNGENIEKEMPELLLLDIWMSGKFGSEICKELKASEKTRHIPVILLSANRDIEEIAKTCGANGFIPKPFKMKDLIEKVNYHINASLV